MPRLHRLDPLDGWHHVMNRGVDRQTIYFADDDRLLFARLLGEIHERWSVQVHSYCLMSNHFHLLLRCPTAGLSEAMQHLLSVFAQRVNARLGRTGHLFGGRFTSRLVTSHAYIANAVRYIHRNPLDIDGVRSPGDYRWSSHRHYTTERPRPEWLYVDRILGWFASPTSFDRFVSGESEAARHPDTIDPDAVLDAVDLVLLERSSRNGRQLSPARRAVAQLLDERLTPDERAQLEDRLGIRRSTSAARTARHRARSLLRSEPELADVEARVSALLGLRPPAGLAA